jgi:hypothetical protein
MAGKQDYSLAVSNIALADLNGDGKIDLCNGIGLTGVISVLANTSSGTDDFSFLPAIDFTTGNYDTFTATGDLDGDGKPELIAVNTTLNTVSILRNKINDPVINSLSGDTAGKGDTITLTGTNLSSAKAVTFGGTAASSFKVVSPTKIDAVAGAGASGNITVITQLGAATIAGFKFIPAISAGGVTTFCQGSSVQLTSTAAANNQWYKDGTFVSGATGNTYQATATGMYTVETTSNNITTASTGIAVSVTTVPAPVISSGPNNTLVSNTATGNQWYLNAVLIAGATDQTYQPTQNGSYTVKTMAGNCSSDFSTSYQFVTTGIIDLGNNQYISIYPNPVKDKLNINWNINGVAELNLAITDIQGKQLMLRNIQNGVPIDISKLPQGIYFIKLYSKTNLSIHENSKIIKGK